MDGTSTSDSSARKPRNLSIQDIGPGNVISLVASGLITLNTSSNP
jgi:hypothetical protein